MNCRFKNIVRYLAGGLSLPDPATIYEYDLDSSGTGTGQVSEESIERIASVNEYQYDALGRLRRFSDRVGSAWVRTYDGISRIIGEASTVPEESQGYDGSDATKPGGTIRRRFWTYRDAGPSVTAQTTYIDGEGRTTETEIRPADGVEITRFTDSTPTGGAPSTPDRVQTSLFAGDGTRVGIHEINTQGDFGNGSSQVTFVYDVQGRLTDQTSVYNLNGLDLPSVRESYGYDRSFATNRSIDLAAPGTPAGDASFETFYETAHTPDAFCRVENLTWTYDATNTTRPVNYSIVGFRNPYSVDFHYAPDGQLQHEIMNQTESGSLVPRLAA